MTETRGPRAPGPSRPMSQPQSSSVDVEVRYAETDQMGVVHHSVYLVWFELARTRLCLETGFHYAEIEEHGFYLVVTRTETRLVSAARYGDVVAVSSRLGKLTSRGLRFEYAVERRGELLASGATEHVWVDRKTGRPCRIPPILKEPFARLTG